jgi:2,4-dienoyl-CoA reductase-like NADH-dependent reductase (Old Yellow Enzyme family)
MSSSLFSPLELRGVRFKNRIGVSPMCLYSCQDGLATDWHLVHLGSRAVGGAGLVITEAAAVEARGRISPADLGIWSDAQVEPLARIVRFVEEQGSVSGIQIAHAGRKASTKRPWEGSGLVEPEDGGWDDVVAASAIPFGSRYPSPRELTKAELAVVKSSFVSAAQRAHTAGFRLLELHAAHGYLLHGFLSPLSNQRRDEYGGSFDNRARFLLEVVREVRAVWPTDRVLAVRLSSSDWAEGGWTLDDTVALAKRLETEGVDLIDCSSGGNVERPKIPLAPGYQVPFAEAVKRATGLKTAAVGLITDAEQADTIIARGQSDLVFFAREELRDPYFPLHAAKQLGVDLSTLVPPQYQRAF